MKDIKICTSFKDRFFGFMFKKEKLNYGLYFENCNSIHTFFCRQPLNIYFFDRSGNVILNESCFKPWKVKYIKNCYAVLEFSQGFKNVDMGIKEVQNRLRKR